VVATTKLGRDTDVVRASRPRIAEFPFDSVRKRMTTVHRFEKGYQVICKGAPEVLLHPSVASEREGLLTAAIARAHAYAADGLRVLAILAAERPSAPEISADAERDLRLIGLVGLADPLKPSARETIATMKNAGITPVLITGDHPATARSIAMQAASRPSQVTFSTAGIACT
jgi:P-type Ca2+ transporter type 2C